MKYLSWILLLPFFFSCSNEKTDTASPPSIEAISLLGDTLYTPQDESPAAIQKYEQARLRYQHQPDDADSLIWYGRRTAYLGRFQDAIRIYSEGIAKHPEDARMYRHRGHRYISTRQYNKAVADFVRAVELIKGTEDKVEPDGLPNSKNIPLTTLHSNIWYHLGLAYYLQDDLEKALAAFQNRAVTQSYDDNIVSGAHWQYMILRKLGREEEAEAALSEVNKDMDIIENMSYHQMCLFYKGDISEEELRGEGMSSSASDVLIYGLANWYNYEKQDQERTRELLEKLLKNGNPYSFAYLAGEADWERYGW